MEGKVKIGKVSRLHGFKGELSLKLDADYIELFADLDHVYLEIANKPVPYFIEAVRFTPQGYALVYFDGVADQASAEHVRGLSIYVDESSIPVDHYDEDDPRNFEGFLVVDSQVGELGKVAEVILNPAQVLLIIDRPQGEIYIPLHEDFIEEIDYDGQVLKINAPEGLIELNTESSGE